MFSIEQEMTGQQQLRLEAQPSTRALRCSECGDQSRHGAPGSGNVNSDESDGGEVRGGSHRDELCGPHENFPCSLHRVMPEEPDAALVSYFDDKFMVGKSSSDGTRLVPAMEHLTTCYERRGEARLPRAARAWKGWSRMAPTATRQPLL